MNSMPRLALALLLTSALVGPLAACATMGGSDPVALAGVVATPTSEEAEDIIDIEPDRTSLGYFMAGTGAINAGRAADAAKFFDHAARAASEEDRPYLRQQAFTAALMAGDIENAARLAPTDKTAATYRLGRLVNAVDALARGDAARSYAVLGDEAITGNYAIAAGMLRPWAALAKGDVSTATQTTGTSGNSPAQSFAALNQAMVLEVADQPGRAEALYRALAGEMPEVNFFVLSYGDFLERQGRRKEAVALYEEQLKKRPSDRGLQGARDRAEDRRQGPPKLTARDGAAQAMLISAMASFAQDDVGSGMTYLRLSLRLDPDRSEGLLMLGEFLDRAGDHAGARAAYNKVPPSSPDYNGAQARIIVSYQSDEKNAEALATAQRLVQSAPKDAGPRIMLAEVLRITKDYAGAVKVLNQVIAMEGAKADWNLYYARATAHHMAGDWPSAERDLLQALALAPDSSDAQNYLGYTWADRGERLPEALELLKKAAASRPNSGAITDSLGWAYFRTGDNAKAVEYLERAVELEPAAADINDHLGDVYAKVGRTLEARYQWQRVLTLEPEPELKAKVEAKIAANPDPTPVVSAAAVPPAETATP